MLRLHSSQEHPTPSPRAPHTTPAVSAPDTRIRCPWATTDPLLRHYHDTEWGVPLHDSRALWETLMLEGFQAGLSWTIILRKRDSFRRAFANFNPHAVAAFTESDITRLLADPGIVRARSKIVATVTGAQIYLAMQAEGLDFATWLWSFVSNTPIQNSGPVPVRSALSETLSADLRKRGFKFVGPVIVYAFLQATGMVNDHTPDCFLHHARHAPHS